MAKCNCGKSIRGNWKFCPECGTSLIDPIIIYNGMKFPIPAGSTAEDIAGTLSAMYPELIDYGYTIEQNMNTYTINLKEE
jgi:hypothetical protein